jgi:hypothetical protein
MHAPLEEGDNVRTRSLSVKGVWSPSSHADNSDPGMSVMLRMGGSNARLNLAQPGQRCALLTIKSRKTCTRATDFNSSG